MSALTDARFVIQSGQRIEPMNQNPHNPAEASRRDVLAVGMMAALATGLGASRAQSAHRRDLPSSHTSIGAKQMNSITSKDGTEIYYKDWGSKEAQPIVFHHGWPLSGDDWDTQLLYFLNNGYRVIAHDRRGHGRSAQVSAGHDMDHYAGDVAAVVEHLELTNAVHIGHSTGGGADSDEGGQPFRLKADSASDRLRTPFR
jgi:non-heme chloroperoxidase